MSFEELQIRLVKFLKQVFDDTSGKLHILTKLKDITPESKKDDGEDGDNDFGGGVHGGGGVGGCWFGLHAIYKQVIIYKLHATNFFKSSISSVSSFLTHQAKYTLRDRGRIEHQSGFLGSKVFSHFWEFLTPSFATKQLADE